MEIKEIRIKTGMSRKAFCEEFKIPVRTVEDWEAGRRNPPEYVVKMLENQVTDYCNKKAFEDVCKRISYLMSCIYDFSINAMEVEKYRHELVEYLKALPVRKIVKQYHPTEWEYNPENLDWWNDSNIWAFHFSDATENLREVSIAFKTDTGYAFEKNYTYRK